MKKIIFIMPMGSLPVPSCLGGSVETLLTMLIEQNELVPQYEFYIINAKLKNYTTLNVFYKYTKIYNVNISTCEQKLFRFINFINRKFSYKIPLYSPYNKFSYKIIKKIKPDYIIYQWGLDALIKKLKKHFANNIILQLHYLIENKTIYNKNVSKFIAVSNFIKKDWLQSCSNANVQVLPNAINEKHFDIENITQEQKLALRQRLGIKSTDFVVLYTGRVISIKGVLELVKAVVQLQDQTIKLVLVGSTFFGKKIKQTLYQKKIQQIMQNNPNIIATGHLPYEQLSEYYAIADVQAIPSLCEEASGMTAIEGNYCGLPQIITNSGGLPENCSSSAIIIDKKGDVVSQLKDAILKVKKEKITNSKDIKALTAKEYFNEFVNIINRFEDK